MFIVYMFIYLVAVLIFMSLLKAASKESKFEGELIMNSKKEKQVESKIREYFRNQKEVENLNKRLVITRKRIEEIRETLKGTNINFSTDIKAQQYSDDIVGQGGKPLSKVEQELERRYSQIETYLEHYIKEESYIMDKIYNLQIDIEHMDLAFNGLNDIEKKVIIQKFKEKHSMRKIAYTLFGGAERTAYRVYNKAIEKLESGRLLAESWQTFGREVAESWQNS